MSRHMILIGWFLVSLVGGKWHYTGPYSDEECAARLKAVQPVASIAYCDWAS